MQSTERMDTLKHVAAPALAFFALVLAACGGSVTTIAGGDGSAGDDGSPDASGTDAVVGGDAVSLDAPADALYLACMDGQGHLDTAMKTCQSDTDCTIQLETTDCCGTILYVGVSSSNVGAFMTCEAAWDAHFPACGCATGRTGTEDGKQSQPGQDGGAPKVHCTNFTMGGGVCLTYTP